MQTTGTKKETETKTETDTDTDTGNGPGSEVGGRRTAVGGRGMGTKTKT